MGCRDLDSEVRERVAAPWQKSRPLRSEEGTVWSRYLWQRDSCVSHGGTPNLSEAELGAERRGDNLKASKTLD